jgi:hypothetical protein
MKALAVLVSWGLALSLPAAEGAPAPPKAGGEDGPGARPGPVPPAEALNVWLAKLQALQRRGADGPTVNLGVDVLRRVNVARGATRADLGLLKQAGRLPWPEALQGPAFKDARGLADARLAAVLRQAEKGGVKAEDLRGLNQAVDDLTRKLAAEINELTPTQFIGSRRFLLRLGGAVKGIPEPGLGENLRANRELATGGRTVAELVQYLTDNRLRFAPPAPGDEAAYREVEKAFAAYARRAR